MIGYFKVLILLVLPISTLQADEVPDKIVTIDETIESIVNVVTVSDQKVLEVLML